VGVEPIAPVRMDITGVVSTILWNYLEVPGGNPILRSRVRGPHCRRASTGRSNLLMYTRAHILEAWEEK